MKTELTVKEKLQETSETIGILLTIKQLMLKVGTISSPRKMPCAGYSIPTKNCHVGSNLAKVVGSVCKGCYARKGNYMFPKIQECLEKRRDIMLNDPNWVNNMAELINRKEKSGYFRWFDSGDLQSLDNLKNIIAICNLTPKIKHWLPTKEYSIVSTYINEGGIVPKNLVIRLSGYMINMDGPKALVTKLGINCSAVSNQGKHTCFAYKNDNKCGDCRKCWNKNVLQVTYKKHG